MNRGSGFEGFCSRLAAWLMRRMPNERQRLLAITIVAGGLCGLAAVQVAELRAEGQAS